MYSKENFNQNNLEKLKKVSKNIVMGLIFSGLFSCNDTKTTSLQSEKDSLAGAKTHRDLRPLDEVYDDADSLSGENFTITTRPELIVEIEKQKGWLLSYIGSSMYRMRLISELERSGIDHDEAVTQANHIIEERKHNLVTGKYAIKSKLDPRGQLWTAGITASRKDQTIILKTGEFSRYVPNQYSPKRGNTYFESSLYDNPEGRDGYETIPVHEFTHQSTDGDAGLIINTQMELDTLAKEDFIAHFKDAESGVMYNYLDDPTEVLARVNVLRYLLSKYGIYDAGTEIFTDEHIDKLLKVKEIHDDSGVEDLMKYILKNREGLVWIMNNVAQIETLLSDDIENTA